MRHHRANDESPLQAKARRNPRGAYDYRHRSRKGRISRSPSRINPDAVDEERQLSRDRFLQFFAQQPPATIILEACSAVHITSTVWGCRRAPRTARYATVSGAEVRRPA